LFGFCKCTHHFLFWQPLATSVARIYLSVPNTDSESSSWQYSELWGAVILIVDRAHEAKPRLLQVWDLSVHLNFCKTSKRFLHFNEVLFCHLYRPNHAYSLKNCLSVCVTIILRAIFTRSKLRWRRLNAACRLPT
jgi:hypothetical protein